VAGVYSCSKGFVNLHQYPYIMYVAHNRRLSQGDICDIAAHESPVSH